MGSKIKSIFARSVFAREAQGVEATVVTEDGAAGVAVLSPVCPWANMRFNLPTTAGIGGAGWAFSQRFTTLNTLSAPP